MSKGLTERLESLSEVNSSLNAKNGSLLEQVGTLLEQIDNYQTEVESQKTMIEAIRNYAYVATLGVVGYPAGTGPGSDISTSSPLIDMLEGTYEFHDHIIHMKRDRESEQKYMLVINEYPRFPFAYYFLCLCLRERNDKEWITYAKKARDILVITTSFDGHNEYHDQILKNVESLLSGAEESGKQGGIPVIPPTM